MEQKTVGGKSNKEPWSLVSCGDTVHPRKADSKRKKKSIISLKVGVTAHLLKQLEKNITTSSTSARKLSTESRISTFFVIVWSWYFHIFLPTNTSFHTTRVLLFLLDVLTDVAVFESEPRVVTADHVAAGAGFLQQLTLEGSKTFYGFLVSGCCKTTGGFEWGFQGISRRLWCSGMVVLMF